MHKQKFCECGCGASVRQRFVSGHNVQKGRTFSAETRKKISEAAKLRTPVYGRQPTLGMKFSAESRAKMSAALRRRKIKDSTREKLRQANLGKKHSPEAIEKIKAYVRSPERREQARKWMAELNARPEHKEYLRKVGKYVRALSPDYGHIRTKIEIRVREELSRMGIKFKEQHVLSSCPRFVWDFAIPGAKVLIEVDGCYWHGCETCGHDRKKSEKSDRNKNEAAKACGWKLIRIPEHDINSGAFKGALGGIRQRRATLEQGATPVGGMGGGL